MRPAVVAPQLAPDGKARSGICRIIRHAAEPNARRDYRGWGLSLFETARIDRSGTSPCSRGQGLTTEPP